MDIKSIAQNTFWQLLIVYIIFIFLIAIGFLGKYVLYFNILALIIAIFGISILNNKDKKSESNIPQKLQIALFILSIILIIIFRIIPYVNNSIPLGYDAGLYKYGIEKGLVNLDQWILYGGMEPGFLYLMKPLSWIFSVQFLLTFGFIFFIVLLGFAIYVFSREYFDKNTAILSLLIYSLSLIQFKVFTYLYYKNIIALSLILFAFYFLKRENYKFFILTGILIGAIHRPSFYIFGLSYFLYAFAGPYEKKKYSIKLMFKNIFYGLIILAGALAFYLEKFKPAIFSIISPVLSSFVSPGESPGTFLSFHEYQFSILFYLPLALIGFFWLIKNKRFNIFFFYTSLCLIIVYFQLFFFNRFIIFLDIALIILAGLGTKTIIEHKKKLGLVIVVLLLISGAILTAKTSLNEKPHISKEVFDSINSINIQKNAYIISISSKFSPYLQGYTTNRIIAPGMFDYDLWKNEERWTVFWTELNASELKKYYQQDIYLFTTNDLNSSCYLKSSQNLYRLVC